MGMERRAAGYYELAAHGRTFRIDYGARLLGRRLLGDDEVLDLVVSGLRDDFLFDQVGFCVVRAAVNYFLRVGGADSRQRVELLFGCAIQIH